MNNNLSEELKPALFGVERVRVDVIKRRKTDPGNKDFYSLVNKRLNGILSDMISLDDFIIQGSSKNFVKRAKF